MTTRIIEIDGKKICDNNGFHNEFSEKLGFPDFYGRNMNAWIDCMSDITDPDSGMTGITIQKDEVLTLHILHTKHLKEKNPDLYNALIECTSFVNNNLCEEGGSPALSLKFSDEP